MTMAWGKWRESQVPCVVSTGVLWLRGPRPGGTIDRLLSGKELLQLQGFDAHWQEAVPHSFTQKKQGGFGWQRILWSNSVRRCVGGGGVRQLAGCVLGAKDHAVRQAVALSEPEPQPDLTGLAPAESLDGDSLCGEEETAESEEPEVDLEVDPDSDFRIGSMLN